MSSALSLYFMASGECQRQCNEQRHRGQYQAENDALWDA